MKMRIHERLKHEAREAELHIVMGASIVNDLMSMLNEAMPPKEIQHDLEAVIKWDARRQSTARLAKAWMSN